VLVIQKLEDFWRLSKEQPLNSSLQQALDTACVQAFEYTYELSHKMLKRYLEATETNKENMDTFSFQNLIRVGSESDLNIRVDVLDFARIDTAFQEVIKKNHVILQ
jgi:hypothetical protein